MGPRCWLALLMFTATGAAQSIPLTLRVDGWDRTARIVIPTNRPGPLPAVLILHGAGGSGAGYLEKNGWERQALTSGFIAIAPDGLPSQPQLPAAFRTNPRLWNSGQLREGSPRAGIDDLRYFAALIDAVADRHPLDRRRIYATGHSNGGAMAWRIAAENADHFAAVAPVCGLMAVELPRPIRGIPVWAISGALDPLQPLAGGESHLPWGNRTTPPVRAGVARFAVGLGCPMAPKQDSDQWPGLDTLVWGPGRDGALLRWSVIQGHGHAWPGGQDSGLPASLLGPSTSTLEATPAIWAFFSAHRLSER